MERRKEAEEPVNSGGNRRVMEERGLVGRRKEIEVEKIKWRKSNSKFKWHLSQPRIQGTFTNVVLLNQSKSSIIPIHPWGDPYRGA